MRFVPDALMFLTGYVMVGRWATGGGIVDPTVIASGGDASFTVVAAIGAGVLAVLVWRVLRLLLPAARRPGATSRH